MNEFPLTVISLTAPWSWLVVGRLKRYETRSWSTKHRGVLGIHTAASLAPVGGPEGLLALCRTEPFYSALVSLGITRPLDEPRGHIIGVANLTCIQETEDVAPTLLGTDELAFGNYAAFRFAWRLEGAVKLTSPIKATGRQRLWHYLPPVATQQGALA